MSTSAPHDQADRPAWQTPRLVRLGSLRDIAQPGANINQGAAGKGVPIAS
ncbi:hypothetical protein [Qipengyuania sp.]